MKTYILFAAVVASTTAAHAQFSVNSAIYSFYASAENSSGGQTNLANAGPWPSNPFAGNSTDVHSQWSDGGGFHTGDGHGNGTGSYDALGGTFSLEADSVAQGQDFTGVGYAFGYANQDIAITISVPETLTILGDAPSAENPLSVGHYYEAEVDYNGNSIFEANDVGAFTDVLSLAAGNYVVQVTASSEIEGSDYMQESGHTTMSGTFSPTPAPEPFTCTGMAIGCAGLFFRRSRLHSALAH